jgi:hypothetical protein
MLDHLFLTYGNITAVYLENNFEQMREAWDPQHPVETLFKQIQYCADFSESGALLIGHPQKINVGYANIFATGDFMSACRRWKDKDTVDKTWANFKVHFAAAHCQHKQMQGGSATANSDVGQTEYQMEEATIGDLASLKTDTATDRGVVATLTEATIDLVKKLEDRSNKLKYIKAILKKERSERKGKRTLNLFHDTYRWSHGYKVANSHTSLSYNYPNHGHKREATKADNMGGSQANRE